MALHNSALRLFVTGIFMSLLAVRPAAPQSAPTTTAPQQGQPSAGTDLVEVPVEVSDESGRPVTGLRSHDFVLLEKGKEQPTQALEEVSPATLGASGLLPPSAAASAKPVLFILLDPWNSNWDNAPRTAIRILAQATQEGQPCSVVLMTKNGLKTVHGFATPPDVTQAALLALNGQAHLFKGKDTQLLPAAAPVADPAAVQSETNRLLALLRSSPRDLVHFPIPQEERAMMPFLAFQDLAAAARTLPGRKYVVWLVDRFLLDEIDPSAGNLYLPIGQGYLPATTATRSFRLTVIYQQAVERLNEAHLSVYPSGLRSSFISDFALATGGHAFTGDLAHSSPDIDPRHALGEILSQVKPYYLLTYRPDRGSDIAEYRKISVRITQTGTKARVSCSGGTFLTTKDVLEQQPY